jgi:hypothetical protein
MEGYTAHSEDDPIALNYQHYASGAPLHCPMCDQVFHRVPVRSDDAQQASKTTHLIGELGWEVVDLSGLILGVQGPILGTAVHGASRPIHLDKSEVWPNPVPLQAKNSQHQQQSCRRSHDALSFTHSFIALLPIRRSGCFAAAVLWQPSSLPCLGNSSPM